MTKLQKARTAVFLYFLVGGTAIAVWAVHIPAVEDRLKISHAVIGSLLLLVGAGAFTSMEVMGRIIDRIGSKTATQIGGIACGLSLFLPAFAPDVFWLALALFVLGLGIGAVDVSMNAHAIEVEREYKRPIFSAFHAMWSIGGIVGSAIGAFALGLSIPMQVTLSVCAVILTFTSIAIGPMMLPNNPNEVHHENLSRTDKKIARKSAAKANRSVFGYVLFVGLLGTFAAIAEGSAVDWSALHLSSVLKTSESFAALGVLVFSLTMTAGRLTADRFVNRFGRMWLVRWGCSISALGFLVAIFSTDPMFVLVGYGIVGIGLAAVIPQIFAAAGSIGEESHAGRNMAKVVGLVYIGILSGPAVIGWITVFVPLNFALLLSAVLCAIVAVGSKFVKAAS